MEFSGVFRRWLLKGLFVGLVSGGSLESYRGMRNHLGEDKLVPIYIEVDDGVRLERALIRERQQKEPKYEELCRRFLADAADFSEEKLLEAGIHYKFYNDNMEKCVNEIILGIRGKM